MSLKKKAIHGLKWSLIDSVSLRSITFVIGIILARLLTPKDFGVIGMITIIIALSNTLTTSGFGSALIRKRDCNKEDFSTVFWYNLGVGTALYFLMFLLADSISSFFQEPILKSIIQVLSIVIVLESLSMVQSTILTKNVDFKLQAKISIISSVLAGILGIFLALLGMGVWSLVVKQLTQSMISALLLWFWNKWRPVLHFNKQSFKELFYFGYKLTLSSLINTIYRNIYYLVIGKFFSSQELGYYTRASQFAELPSSNIDLIIKRVTYPVMAEIKDNPSKLKYGYKMMIQGTMLVTFVVMLLLAAVAEPLVITLIGNKWRNSIEYLQLLSFLSMMYPLNSLNLNILNVTGRSDLSLKLEVLKRLLAVPIILLGIQFGIIFMIVGLIFHGFLSYYLNSYWSGTIIEYPMIEQLKDILPSFLIGITIASSIYALQFLTTFAYPILLTIQLLFAFILFFLTLKYIKTDAVSVLKDLMARQPLLEKIVRLT